MGRLIKAENKTLNISGMDIFRYLITHKKFNPYNAYDEFIPDVMFVITEYINGKTAEEQVQRMVDTCKKVQAELKKHKKKK